jgi:hypothetical protein
MPRSGLGLQQSAPAAANRADGASASESDQLLRCTEVTRRAISDIFAPQKISNFLHSPATNPAYLS